MSLRNLSIAPRAALGFGLVALLVLLLGAFSLLQMTEMRKQSEAVDQDWLPSVMALGEVSQDILRLRSVTLRLMLNDPDGASDAAFAAEAAGNTTDALQGLMDVLAAQQWEAGQ